jgi:hypothetical protein
MSVSGIIVGKSFLTLMINGETHTVNNQHPNYTKIREAVRNKDFNVVESLINIGRSITNFTQGRVRVENGSVYYADMEVKNVLVDRILDMINEGFDASPMVRFLENLMQNPSKRAVDELYLFLEQTSLPITDDGHFLAYKKVRDDYRDFYTGKMDNSVGQVVEMLRNQVDDERNNTCSYGLHFCSLSYLPYYYGDQGHVMIVKINPADVVSIPNDYNNAKGRTCRYEVIGEHHSENMEAFFKPVYMSSQCDIDDDNDTDNDTDYDQDDDYSQDDDAYDAGYDQGYSDATSGNAYNHDTTLFASAIEIAEYRAAYAEGWDYAKVETAISRNSQKLEVDLPAAGLLGYNQGRSDSANLRMYNSQPAVTGGTEYDSAYAAAYDKGWNSLA